MYAEENIYLLNLYRLHDIIPNQLGSPDATPFPGRCTELCYKKSMGGGGLILLRATAWGGRTPASLFLVLFSLAKMAPGGSYLPHCRAAHAVSSMFVKGAEIFMKCTVWE